MKKRHTEAKIFGVLCEADAGLPVEEPCRTHGFREPSYYAWKAAFAGMKVSDAQRLKALQAENTLLAHSLEGISSSLPSRFEVSGLPRNT